ncbi:MAG TPA: bifunctional phosphoribosylaminoimidazolecarboxamide formyltransferase/IMP cyclohydrolase [Thermoanaerobaculia bacterium]|nr:bifunctional phosphoribosylaminoimidazolecarboxamide formyltransferase/IMP cyclohydrolase [Thermoanaerobaculia bacterium]
MKTAIKRAILSVSDKTGIVELGRFLAARGVEILSTGGTADHLTAAAVPVTKISEYSGAPEILGGRVKTLTPKVFAGILFDRDQASHIADCQAQQFPPIDLVVVNLYPFESTIAKPGVPVAQAIEQIDVGGPSMLRAAAKNHRHVLPLCDPSLYAEFMAEMEKGELSDDFRLRAAVAVFTRTSEYDQAIQAFLRSHGTSESEAALPASFVTRLPLRQSLRYGENPQQRAGFYSDTAAFHQIQGKELSYNNLLDLDAAGRLASAFSDPACTIIKHTNPCGTATAVTLAEAVRLALEADPVSAFGGIVGVNRELDAESSEVLAGLFLEVIAAPSFSAAARDLFAKKKNLRLITTVDARSKYDVRSACGGLLVQTPDGFAPFESWKTATTVSPTPDQLKALQFAWILCAHVKSNAIVLTRGTQSLGIGAGQMSRVDSAKIAVMKSLHETRGSVAASDAFFPFRDGLDILIDAGVTAVVQPGGSVRDEEVIAAANERGIAMVLTGQRHFRH